MVWRVIILQQYISSLYLVAQGILPGIVSILFILRGHGIVFSASGVVSHTPLAEKSKLEKRRSQDRSFNIGIQFQAISNSSQIQGGRFFCILTPLVLGGGSSLHFHLHQARLWQGGLGRKEKQINLGGGGFKKAKKKCQQI